MRHYFLLCAFTAAGLLRAQPASSYAAESPEVRVEAIEYLQHPGTLSVRLRFSSKMNAASAGGVTLRAADGSVVRARAQFSIDGCEWVFQLPSVRRVRVFLDGVEDAWGRRLRCQSREPTVVL
jgi:hypothetical protein